MMLDTASIVPGDPGTPGHGRVTGERPDELPPGRPGSMLEHPLAPAFVVAALALLAGLAVMTPWMVGAFYDDGTYLVLAKSLASGNGYRYLNLPGTPPATHFPPGYPVFLALFLRLSPDIQTGIALAKLANAALLPAVALGAFTFCRRILGWKPWPAAGVSLLGVTAPALLSMNAGLMSETLFLAALFPALILSERLARRSQGAWAAAGLGALLGILQLIRSIGLPALGAVLLVLALRRRWRDGVWVFAAAAAVVAPWAVWVAAHAGSVSPALAANYGSYGDWVGQSAGGRGWEFLLHVVQHNLPVHARFLGNRFMPVDGALPGKLAFGGFLVAAAAGALALRRVAPVTLLFLAGYVVLVLTWPFAPDRFYYPLEPLLAILIASGAAAALVAWKHGGEGASRGALALSLLVAASTAVLLAGEVREHLDNLHERRWERRQRLVHDAMLPVVASVRAHAIPGGVVGTDLDPLVYLYAGRQTVPVVNYRAAYYLDPPGETAPPVLQDSRELLAEFRPAYAVIRAGAPNVRSAMAATIPGLPVAASIVDTLPKGGLLLRLRWATAPRPRP